MKGYEEIASETPYPEPHESHKVFVLAPHGRDAELARKLVEQSGEHSILCHDLEDLLGRIAAGSGPIIIAEEAIDREGVERLEAHLAAHPSWSDPPILIFTSRHPMPERLRPLAEQRNTTLLRRPISAPSFRSVIRSALRSCARQHEVRRLLESSQELNEQLEERARQLQRLVVELGDTEERERSRLARILHDDLQQLLAAAKFRLNGIKPQQDPEAFNQRIEGLHSLLEEAIHRARNLSHELSPALLHQNGLVPALHWLADSMRDRHGLDIDLEIDAADDCCDEPARFLLFRIAQELTFNIVKHSGTEQARLELREKGKEVQLEIKDRGRGFSLRELDSGPRAGGLGLLDIRERVSLMGGDVLIDSRPGAGTRIRVSLPQHGTKAAKATDRLPADSSARAAGSRSSDPPGTG